MRTIFNCASYLAAQHLNRRQGSTERARILIKSVFSISLSSRLKCSGYFDTLLFFMGILSMTSPSFALLWTEIIVFFCFSVFGLFILQLQYELM